MRIVRSLDEDRWRNFIETHPQGNIFHTPEMYEVFTRAKGYHPQIWGAVDDHEEIYALFLPVLVTLSEGLMSRATTRAIAYGSILSVPTSQGQLALTELLMAYTTTIKSEALFTELRHLSDMNAFGEVLDQVGFRYEEHLNYLIRLDKPEEKILKSMSSSARKAVRRSERRGMMPEELHDQSLLPIHYGLLRQSYEQAKVPLSDISLFRAVFDILVPKGMAKMLLARIEGDYAAASIELPYKDIIYSWYSGYDYAFRHIYPNEGLVWYILKWGARNGYRYFDFGGAGHPDEEYGPRDFKAKFGGKLVNFGRHTYVHAPFLLAMSRVGYQIYRQVCSFF